MISEKVRKILELVRDAEPEVALAGIVMYLERHRGPVDAAILAYKFLKALGLRTPESAYDVYGLLYRELKSEDVHENTEWITALRLAVPLIEARALGESVNEEQVLRKLEEDEIRDPQKVADMARKEDFTRKVLYRLAGVKNKRSALSLALAILAHNLTELEIKVNQQEVLMNGILRGVLFRERKGKTKTPEDVYYEVLPEAKAVLREYLERAGDITPTHLGAFMGAEGTGELAVKMVAEAFREGTHRDWRLRWARKFRRRARWWE